MSNPCYGCAACVKDACDIVTDFLMYPPESITRRDVERYKAYVRLAWRVEQKPDHDDAGWVIQKLLDGEGGPAYDKRVAEFEEDHPVVYPGHLRTIQEIIERRCTVIEPDT